MTEPCLPIEELLALSERPESDPRWSHVRACPRCRSRLKAYGIFLSLAQEEPCPGEEEAVEHVTPILREQIRKAGPVLQGTPPKRPAWFPRRLVPAFGLAAVVAGVLLLGRGSLPHPGGAGQVREAPSTTRESAVTAATVRTLTDGSLELRWSAVASADAYQVRILDAGFQEVARLDAAGETLLVVPVASVRGWPTQAAFWQVEALSVADRIADSAPAALPSRPAR